MQNTSAFDMYTNGIKALAPLMARKFESKKIITSLLYTDNTFARDLDRRFDQFQMIRVPKQSTGVASVRANADSTTSFQNTTRNFVDIGLDLAIEYGVEAYDFDLALAGQNDIILDQYATEAVDALSTKLEEEALLRIINNSQVKATNVIGTENTGINYSTLIALRQKMSENNVGKTEPVTLIVPTSVYYSLFSDNDLMGQTDRSNTQTSTGILFPALGITIVDSNHLPTLADAAALNTAIAGTGTGNVGVAIAGNGAVMVTRSLAVEEDTLPVRIPQLGIAMTVTRGRDIDKRSTKMVWDLLAGVGIVNPDAVYPVLTN